MDQLEPFRPRALGSLGAMFCDMFLFLRLRLGVCGDVQRRLLRAGGAACVCVGGVRAHACFCLGGRSAGGVEVDDEGPDVGRGRGSQEGQGFVHLECVCA